MASVTGHFLFSTVVKCFFFLNLEPREGEECNPKKKQYSIPAWVSRVESQGQAAESDTPPLQTPSPFVAKDSRCYLISSNRCSHALKGNEARIIIQVAEKPRICHFGF